MGDPEESQLCNPNRFLNDGRTYVITVKYTKFDQNSPGDEEPNYIALDVDASEIDLNHCRVATMSNFNVLTKTEFLGLRNNMIKQIMGIEQLTMLRELELYDNQITKIECLDSLTNLEYVLNFCLILI